MNKSTPMREEFGVKKERFIQVTVAVLVVAAALLIWGMLDRADAAPSQSTTVIRLTDDESGGNTYEVKSSDGQLTILENGEPMPEDRILRKGKTLILLGEDGRAVFQALVDEDGKVEYSENMRGSMWVPRAPRFPATPSLYVGISAGQVDGALAAQLGIEKGQGILVSRVFPDSPATKAGLEKHDIITEIDGEAVGSVTDLRKRLGDMETGQAMTLTVLRAAQSRKIEIQPEERDGERVLFFGETPEIGDPPAPPAFYHSAGEGTWNVQLRELSENPGSVRFFGDGDDIAVYAPDADLEADYARQKAELEEREAQMEEMEERLKRLEAMLQELLEQKER